MYFIYYVFNAEKIYPSNIRFFSFHVSYVTRIQMLITRVFHRCSATTYRIQNRTFLKKELNKNKVA